MKRFVCMLGLLGVWMSVPAQADDNRFMYIKRMPGFAPSGYQDTKVDNGAPSFTSSPLTSVMEGSGYSYIMTAEDPEGDSLSFTSAEKLPAWLSLTDYGTGVASLSGFPGEGDVGDYVISLLVSDGSQSSRQDFTITVAANGTPIFTSAAETVVREGDYYGYTAMAEDLEGDSLTLTAPTLPAWMTFTPDDVNATGLLEGNPEEGEIGDHEVVLEVTDGLNSSTQAFTVTVLANAAPLFVSLPSKVAEEGIEYVYDITVDDPDAMDTLYVSGISLPSWLTLVDNGDRTATLSGTPMSGDVGPNDVMLDVSDDIKDAQQSFTITVAPNSSPVWVSPSTDLGTFTVDVAMDPIVFLAEDTNGDVTYEANVKAMPAGLSFDGDTLSGTPTEAGDYTIDVTAYDSSFAGTTEFFTMTVLDKAAITALPATVTVNVEGEQEGMSVTGDSETVTVTNCATCAPTAALSVMASAVEINVSVANDTCTGTVLGTGESCTFDVVAEASANGICSGEYMISGGAGVGASVMVDGTASGFSDDISISPSIVAINVPEDDDMIAFTVRNCSSCAPMDISYVYNHDRNGIFSIITDSCFDRSSWRGVTLGGGQTCSIVMRFVPQENTTYSNVLEVDYNEWSSFLYANMTGTSDWPSLINSISPRSSIMNVAGAGAVPGATVYGSYTTFTVTNTGGQASATITTSLSNPNNFEFGANTCSGQQIPAGGSCTMQVRAKALDNVDYSATLTVSSGLTGTVTSSLSGTARGFIPPDCSSSLIPGCLAADGTIYAGLTPDGNVPMYVPRCDAGMTWDGTACTGTRSALAWGTYGTLTGISDENTGEANTTALAAYGDTAAAKYCYNLAPPDVNAHGKDDWYLPAKAELNVLSTNRLAIGGFDLIELSSSTHCWSSSETNYNFYAWGQGFSTGAQWYPTKTDGRSVRCARK